jgi:hypothetical protein
MIVTTVTTVTVTNMTVMTDYKQLLLRHETQ